MKKHDGTHKSMKLKHKFVNFDFKQMLVKLSRRVAYQADHFSALIGKFMRLEGLNETEYGKLDEKFLNLLQSTRANLIKISPNYFCTLCEISKSLNELDCGIHAFNLLNKILTN